MVWGDVRNVQIRLLEHSDRVPVLPVEPRFGGPDVAVGSWFFRHHVVTIDPYRGAVLIESLGSRVL
jgi:hypothetical protein